ncbi:MAG: hypothetical protein HYX69_07100 [Planctomycetia bacterium]|nr:hypothetical protein [Planctomycetia bacterium]
MRKRPIDACPHRTALATVLLAVVVAGCGDAVPERPVLHAVSGRLTVAGQPAAGVTINFLPAAATKSAAGGTAFVPTATTQADGSFEVGTFGPGDGAPEGEYTVTAVWTTANDSDDRPSVDRLKGRYADPARSGLTASINAGTNELPPFQLK